MKLESRIARSVVPVGAIGVLVAMLGCGMQKVDADGDGDGDVDGDVEVVVINASGRCGVERWAVKTGTDSTSNLVNLTPQDTTVTSLRAQAMPTSIPSTTRLPTSAETQVWRVSATLTSFKLENDSDIHLVLTDSSGATMIAEIPSTNCDAGSAWATQIAHSRNAFAAKFTASTSFQQANVPVVVTGIGMFDFAHGQTGAAPNQIELHPVFDICFPGSTVSGCGATSQDFTLSASPTALTTAAGASATSSISIAGSGGFAGTVALAASGVPAGASSSLTPANVAAGGNSTLMLSAGSASPGLYQVTVTGTAAGITHNATLMWTIGGSTGSGLVNGGFETGDLTGWRSTGPTSVVSSGAHNGTHAAQVGSTAPTNDSTITQSVTLPAGSPQLSFWFKNVCPDTLQFDWATVTVTSPAGTALATPLAKTCTNTDTWVNVTSDLSSLAGQTVVLTFANHDDNNSGDPTFTLYDDVQIAGGQQSPDFTISVSPPSVSSAGGAAATASVSVAALNGFTGPVSLSTVVPSGASVMFSPTTLTTGTGSSTVTLSTGTAAPGIYNLQISAVGVGITHTANLAWTIGGNGTRLQTVFLIVMENHNWSSIKNSPSAPYINNTLLPMGAHAENYVNVAGIHPSEPNYLWLEAGTNFGVLNDNNPSSNHQSTTSHLVTQLEAAGITWKSYQEGITGTSCPLTTSGLYAPKHNPMVYFDDVTNTNSSSAQRCVQHVRPYTELASDLQNQTVSRYNFITPNLCNDMHNSSGCATSDSIRNGDSWLSTEVPKILASAAYQNGGVLLITWDESEGGDFPIGLIALSPKVKSPGFSNTIPYNHGSTLRTVQEIFGVTPLLGGAATSTDLGDLFQSFP